MSNEKLEDGLASRLTQELGIEMLERAITIAKERDSAAWQIIRKMTDVQRPEVFPDKHFLVVGNKFYREINKLVGYVPLFVKNSDLLEPEQSCIVEDIFIA